MTEIAERFTIVRDQIADYARKYNRDKKDIQLLAVSKGQPLIKIKQAIEAGQYFFGENYLQEALEKIEALKNYPLLEWHFIGTIQRNKTRKIAEHFAWVESLDSIGIAKRLNDQRPAFLPPLNVCIEVNVNEEKTKSGIAINDLFPIVEACLSLPRLRVRGLMTIPAPSDNFHAQRQAFHTLFLAWQKLHKENLSIDTLSMGMSHDFEAAIAEGATIVRIGTGLFGKRE